MAGKDDTFLTLKQQIKSKTTGNLYLFFGEETYIKNTYLKIMSELVPDDGFGDFNRIFIDGKETDTDRIDDAINSFPMMAEKKLVIIKNSGIFKAPKEEIREFWLKELENLPDFVLLIFDEVEVDKRSATYKAVQKAGLCVEFQFMKEYEIAAWVMREAQKSGKKISKDSAELLVSMCDPGIENIKNELDKLCNYSGEEIYKSDIEKVVSKPLNIVIFELTDALMNKQNDVAMAIILRLKENRESAFNILYLLSSAFDKMLQAKLLLEDGYPYNTISTKMKLAPFIAKKYIEGGKGFGRDFLIDRICKTAEYDIAIKQGEIDEWTALMQYVFESLV